MVPIKDSARIPSPKGVNGVVLPQFADGTIAFFDTGLNNHGFVGFEMPGNWKNAELNLCLEMLRYAGHLRQEYEVLLPKLDFNRPGLPPTEALF